MKTGIRAQSLLHLFFVLGALLSGCATETYKHDRYATRYEEPTSGDRARIQVSAFEGSVFAVPNSDCIDWDKPGAGMMISSKKSRYGNFGSVAESNNKSLGMPRGKFYVQPAENITAVGEFYLPAGVPTTFEVVRNGQSREPGCRAYISFTPKKDMDYMLRYMVIGTDPKCSTFVATLDQNGNFIKDPDRDRQTNVSPRQCAKAAAIE